MQDERTIEGLVVSEAGAALSEVTVTACYLGWGRSQGQIVWDKRFCSEPVLTDAAGRYVVAFEGPEYMTLHATKEQWQQIQDSSSLSTKIVLSNIAERNAEQAARAARIEAEFRMRREGETAPDYYCRVAAQRSQVVRLNYQNQTLSITQAALVLDEELDGTLNGKDTLLFGLIAPESTSSTFVSELVFVVDGSPIAGEFELRAAPPDCGLGSHLVQATLPLGRFSREQVGLLAPSVKAGWDMKIWR
ncbi:MAG: hypothetical protein GKR90_09945 [Pseudomonadales bacterium]|nr:hypothetical protein [Pseudomonadales bacterium]